MDVKKGSRVLLVTVALVATGLINRATSAKYISEFTLDELANANYQPVNFGGHNLAAKYSGSSAASAGGVASVGLSADGMPVQHQHQQQASRALSGNRVQLIGE